MVAAIMLREQATLSDIGSIIEKQTERYESNMREHN
jgi:hypothetical protein